MTSISRRECHRCPENMWQRHQALATLLLQVGRGTGRSRVAGPVSCAVRAPLSKLFCRAPRCHGTPRCAQSRSVEARHPR